MYTGHVAIALAARGVRREVPLWVLILSAQACDWVELIVHPFTPRTDTEVYSHAYPFVVVAALVVAASVWLWKRSIPAAITVLLVYLSHPAADYVTGNKPLWAGGPSVGLRFIERPASDFVIQGVVCVLGFAVYWRSLPRTRRRQLVSLTPLALLLVLQGISDLRLGWNRHRRQRSVPNARALASVAQSTPLGSRLRAATFSRGDDGVGDGVEVLLPRLVAHACDDPQLGAGNRCRELLPVLERK